MLAGTATDNGNGTPIWFKAVIQLGVPAALCLFLVYWLTQVANPKLELIAPLNGAVLSHIDASGKVNAEILFYLRSMCINEADTAIERARCVPPR